jgi:hypothetical protein
MTTPDASPLPDSTDGAADKQHGDPLLDSAQGRGDGDDGSRHGEAPRGPAPQD